MTAPPGSSSSGLHAGLLVGAVALAGGLGALVLGTRDATILGGLVAVGTAALCALLVRVVPPSSSEAVVVAVDGWHHVAEEIARARRHGHSVAVVRVDGAAGERLADADTLRRHLRVTDRAWTSGGASYLLLPEADAATVAGLEARLRVDGASPPDLTSRAVVFPIDGVTVGAIRHALEADRRPRQLPRGRGAAASTPDEQVS